MRQFKELAIEFFRMIGFVVAVIALVLVSPFGWIGIAILFSAFK